MGGVFPSKAVLALSVRRTRRYGMGALHRLLPGQHELAASAVALQISSLLALKSRVAALCT